jgi:flagellar hook protein FlgE
MSVQGGLFAGVAAIAAQATAFGIISDNIANANTIGFKETEARFTTLVTRAPTANAFAPGGVASRPLSDAQQQGLLKGTTSATDLAVDGNGFFVVNGAATPGSSDPYMLTRAGSFITDESGRMKNTGGHFLQGWRTDSTGTIINSSTKDLLSSLETVDLGQFSQIASPTSAITIAANLPANKTMGQTETTNLTIYDSEGFDYLLRVNWTKGTATATTLNVWTYTHTLIRDPGQSTAASVAVTTAPGRTMVFNPDGTVRSVNGTAIGTTGTAATETLAITSANFGI